MNLRVRGDSVESLKRFALFEFFDFAQLCADGSLVNIELLPAAFGPFDGEGRGAWFAGECPIIRFAADAALNTAFSGIKCSQPDIDIHADHLPCDLRFSYSLILTDVRRF